MKKILALLMSVMLCFCFAACDPTIPQNKSEVSSVITESETSSFAASDSATTSSEPSSSKQNSTSSKNNSTSSKNTSTSSTAPASSDDTSSGRSSSKTGNSSNTSSITVPNDLLAGIVSRPTVKEEDKVTPIVTSKPTTSVAPVSKVTPLLYKVTGENGTTIYLFGSIHIGKKDMYPLPDYVLNAFSLADSLAVECDNYIDDQTAYQMTQTMLYGDGSKVSDHVSSVVYNAARSVMLQNTDGYAQMIDTVDYFQAIFWSNIIDGMTNEKLLFDGQYGIDNNLIQMANDERKQIIEIESMLGHYQLLASFSDKLQEQLLYSSVYNYLYTTDYRVSLTATYDAWCKGDYKKLREYCTMQTQGRNDEETAILTEYNTKLSVDRDKKMTDFVVKSLKGDKDIFVCVGAAHIVGENAIVDQLKDLGYTVTQITKES